MAFLCAKFLAIPIINLPNEAHDMVKFINPKRKSDFNKPSKENSPTKSQ